MDHPARCGMTARAGLSASPSMNHAGSVCVIEGDADILLTGYVSLPGSLTIDGTLQAPTDGPFPGAFAFSDDPVGPFTATGTLVLDDITQGILKALEFDNGGGTQGGGGDGNMNYRGEWDSATLYNPEDVVTDGTASYVCIATNTNHEPPNGTYWQALGSGASDAADVSYDNGTYTTVQAALDALLYVAPHINSFTNNVGTVELGTTVTAVTLSWTLNKTMTSLALDHSIGSVLGLTSKALTGLSLTSDTTWTLTAGDGQNTTTATSTVAFRNKRYWGASASSSLDNSGVLGLSSEFATNFNKSITYNATGGRYLYYAFPQTFGTPSNVTVGGLAFSDFTVSTLSFTNASGHTETYNVIRFNNIQTGANIQVVWA